MSFVAANIAYVRRQLGQSQAQLADELGIKRSLLGAYEESRATPRYDVLEKISTLSTYSISDLLNKRLVPEGYVPPTKRGRPSGTARAIGAGSPAPPFKSAASPFTPLPPTPKPEPPAAYPATLVVTVDVAGTPQVSLIHQADLSRYGGQSHSAAYVAGLPTLSLPMLEAGQAYRAFELEPGRIHVCRLVRNWASIKPDGPAYYALVYPRGVVLRKAATGSSKRINWIKPDGIPYGDGSEEPLEVWQSEWVLSNDWKPQPNIWVIEERLAALEARMV